MRRAMRENQGGEEQQRERERDSEEPSGTKRTKDFRIWLSRVLSTEELIELLL